MSIMKDLLRVIRWVAELFILLTAMLAIAWAFGAVWFDAPFGNTNGVAAGLLVAGFAITLVFVRPFWRKIAAVALLFGVVLAWWLTLSPTNDSDWQPDMAKEAWALGRVIAEASTAVLVCLDYTETRARFRTGEIPVLD